MKWYPGGVCTCSSTQGGGESVSSAQLLASLRRYQTRAKYLISILRELFSIIRGPADNEHQGEICMVSVYMK